MTDISIGAARAGLYEEFRYAGADGGRCRANEARLEWALVLSNVSGASILTHHHIRSTPGRPEIGPGQPVDKAVARRLLEQLARTDRAKRGWLPENLLLMTDDCLAWHVPGSVRPMFFKIDARPLTVRVAWPALIFVALRNGDLKVFAHRDSGRPAARTQLFHAPLANIYDDGRLCWGSIAVPAFGLESIPAYEAAIYKTYFSKPNHDDVLAKEKGEKEPPELLTFLRGLAESKAPTFPSNRLAKFGNSLGAACDD